MVLIVSRFLLVRFHMDVIERQTNVKALRQALDSLPPNLDAAYNTTMERIKDSPLAFRVLSWVLQTPEPMFLSDLRYAVAIKAGMTELDPDDLDDEETLVSVCAGLVVVQHHWFGFGPEMVAFVRRSCITLLCYALTVS
jgi:hypothetical protein